MLLSAVVCLLLGAVVGLKFNVKMIARAVVVAALIWILVAVVGKVSVWDALLGAVVDAIGLQTGYFVSLIMAALGLTANHDEPAVLPAAEHEPFDAKAEFHRKV